MGEAGERGKLAVVFDANVIISSLISESGSSRLVVTLTPIIYPSYYPEILRKEVLKYIPEIAQKAGRPENEISTILESILEHLREVKSRELTQFIEVSISYVEDKANSLYVATALYLKRGFKQVVIITWNKEGYGFWQLIRNWIRVLTPHEFYVNYLRPQLAPLCLKCAVDRVDMAIKAALLYLNEPDYIIVEHLSNGSIELETYCHIVLIKYEKDHFAICPQRLDIKECIEIYEKPMTEERTRNTIKAANEICRRKIVDEFYGKRGPVPKELLDELMLEVET